MAATPGAGAHRAPALQSLHPHSPMLKALCSRLFDLHGWEFAGEAFTDHPRCVVTAAPHTSNWDFVYTIASFDRLGLPMRFTIKQEWLKPPFGPMMRSVGALPIDRSPKTPGAERPSMVEAMVGIFDTTPGPLALVIPPEGSRSLRRQWKTGFYHVAKLAGVPILLGFLDYEKKLAGIGGVLHPGDDMDADMRSLMRFYSDIHPRYPDLFALDERYPLDPP